MLKSKKNNSKASKKTVFKTIFYTGIRIKLSIAIGTFTKAITDASIQHKLQNYICI